MFLQAKASLFAHLLGIYERIMLDISRSELYTEVHSMGQTKMISRASLVWPGQVQSEIRLTSVTRSLYIAGMLLTCHVTFV